MNVAVEEKKGRTVWDAKGTAYQLVGKLAEGGQGIVCTTTNPGVLVKVSHHPNTNLRTQRWAEHLQWISRLDLDGLNIARPLIMLNKPRAGYVMELMDGLQPLQKIMDETHRVVMEGEGLSGFISTGGLRRRLRMLTQLAGLLANLHGRGLAYGDLSPANIFVSDDVGHAEVWLIDCDNLCLVSRAGGHPVYTRDYGAPEIMRGESGVNSLTDCWSFSVIAFQLLCLQHPFKGDLVNEGEPEREDAALRGELPWVDHPDDDTNRSSGLPREWVCTSALRELFERAFNAGRDNPGARPSMVEWRVALEKSEFLLMDCDDEEGCGSSFIANNKRACSFCDHVQDADSHLVLSSFLYDPEFLDQEEKQSPWLDTGYRIVVGRYPVFLRSSPVGTTLYQESDPLCRLTLTDAGLQIERIGKAVVALQTVGVDKSEMVRTLKLPLHERRRAPHALHLGKVATPHYVWQFRW